MSRETPAPRPARLRDLGVAFSTVTEMLLDRGVGLEEAVSAFTTGYIRTALGRHGGNVSQAALALGVHRNTVRAKLNRNGHKTPRSR